MGVTDFFAGEIATELLKQLLLISRKSTLCKSSAEQLITYINDLYPIIQETKFSGNELPQIRQSQLDRFSKLLQEGLELSNKVLASGRWNVYKNLQLARKMEKLEKKISGFMTGIIPAHTLAEVHHMKVETAVRFDQLDRSSKGLAMMMAGMRIDGRGAGWIDEEMKRVDEVVRIEDEFVNYGESLEVGKRKVKELIMELDGPSLVGVSGIGGSGKTTLARELCKDDQVRCYFGDRIIFLTVSQSPDVEQLRARVLRFIIGNDSVASPFSVPNPFGVPSWKSQSQSGLSGRTLVVLDDVWSGSVLDHLIFRSTGCKTLVVSRFKFPAVINSTYEVELLKEAEAIALFCNSAFGKPYAPLGADDRLVKQIVKECKGLPLALKVIGASLRDQSEMYWASAKNRLSRGQPICENHESKLLERMAISIQHLPDKVRECFLDLGAFPEDRKIPLHLILNMWVEIHDIDEEEAFSILMDLANKNLLTLVKDARSGDICNSYYEISVTQHDVLRDLALHLNNRGNVNERRRLLMPRREDDLPREWERNTDQPFNAKIVSIHTGEMKEMDWCWMDFPKAEVLILNFSSNDYYFLPPFVSNMPKLRTLSIINHGSTNAILRNLSVLDNLAKLRSLWLEKVSIPHLFIATVPLKALQKLCLILCKMNNCPGQSMFDLPELFPCLSELAVDHCDDLIELPSSICEMKSIKSLSITNCPNLFSLPASLNKLSCLRILRLYACPNLKALPNEISQMIWLNYLDISQCVNLRCLPEDIGKLAKLEKIDMRECLQIISLPNSAKSLQSLRCVICDEEVSWLWRDLEKAMPKLLIQVAEKSFDLDWLNE